MHERRVPPFGTLPIHVPRRFTICPRSKKNSAGKRGQPQPGVAANATVKKKGICKFFKKYGACRFGDKCKWQHVRDKSPGGEANQDSGGGGGGQRRGSGQKRQAGAHGRTTKKAW